MIGLYDMAWFPKPFGPGDMHSAGETKVLGRPEVNFVDLLVRETAQNSWDARLSDVEPGFELRLRDLDERARDVLTWNVFGRRVPGSDLDRALSAPQLNALEVVDRGTKGLGGATRNGTPRTPGEANDYSDFILTVGAPPDDPAGGGSYGFGKTASYMASKCGTIVVWSRSRTTDGELVERFVASSMGETFDFEGQRYTGRQWWGAHPGDDEHPSALAFDPVSGEDARALGEAVFERHFDRDETGTSILILDFHPRDGGFADEAEAVENSDPWPSTELDDDDVAEALDFGTLAATLARSVVWNLWPKLDPEQDPSWKMTAAVYNAGATVPLPGMDDSPLLASLRTCLRAVRDVQAGVDPRGHGIHVVPMTRYGSTTGHLALTRVLGEVTSDPFRGVADSVALMRHQAELVVTYEPHPGNTMESVKWVGVFKPVRQLDKVFGDAEPPAHDSWSHVEALDKRTRSIVNVTLHRIREGVRGFLAPAEVAPEASGLSTGALSSALSGLAGGLTGTAAASEVGRSGGRRPRGSSQPKVEVLAVEPVPRNAGDQSRGQQRSRVTLAVPGAERPSLLQVGSLSLAIDGGTMRSEGGVAIEGWEGGRPSGEGVIIAVGEVVHAIISYPAGTAISFDFRVRAA